MRRSSRRAARPQRSFEPLEPRLALSTVAGDVNLDGTVDLADFAVVKSRFNAIAASRLEGDLDGDHRVDLADFSVLRSSFGDVSDVETAAIPSFAQLAASSHGSLKNRIDVPTVEPLPLPTDPASGLKLRRETVTIGAVVRTYEYYPDGKLYSEYYHENGAKIGYYPDGSKFFSHEAGRDVTLYYDQAGRRVRSVDQDGVEYRFAFFDSGEPAVEQRFRGGTLLRADYYREDGSLRLTVDLEVKRDDAGAIVDRGKLRVFHASGALHVLYDPDFSNLVQVYADDAAPGESAGRRIVWGDFAKAWQIASYWKGTDVEQVRQFWDGDKFLYAEVFDASGTFLFRERNLGAVADDPVARNAAGLAELPSSDEVLSFLNIPNEWVLASAPDLDAALWVESFRVNVNDPLSGAEGWHDARDRYQTLVDSAQRHNPHLAIGTNYSLFVSPRAELQATGIFPHYRIPLEDVPSGFVEGVDFITDRPEADLAIDLANPAARAWLTQHLIDEGLGRGARPKTDILFLDAIFIDGWWKHRVEVLSTVKQALNAEGVRLHLNIGGHGFLSPDNYFTGDLFGDLERIADAVMIESPWRLDQRTVADTTGLIATLRGLLDRDMSVELWPAEYLATSLKSGRQEPTTVSAKIQSIHEVRIDFEGESIPALRVRTQRPHYVFPTSGGDGIAIELVDLPAGFEAWEGRYRPVPVPGAPDQVDLVATHPSSRMTVLGRHLTAPGDAYLFDHGQIKRMMAGLAMLVREPGDSLVVGSTYSQADPPGGGEPDHIDNWQYWPSIFGEPMGAATIDQSSGGQVIKISRRFERGTIAVYPQTGRVDALPPAMADNRLLDLIRAAETAAAAIFASLGGDPDEL